MCSVVALQLGVDSLLFRVFVVSRDLSSCVYIYVVSLYVCSISIINVNFDQLLLVCKICNLSAYYSWSYDSTGQSRASDHPFLRSISSDIHPASYQYTHCHPSSPLSPL